MAVIEKKPEFSFSGGTILPSDPTPQAQLGNNIGGFVPSPITVASLSQPTTPLNVPPVPLATDFRPTAATSLESLMSNFNAPTPQEQQFGDVTTELSKTLQKLGTQGQRKQQLEGEAGLPAQRK